MTAHTLVSKVSIRTPLSITNLTDVTTKVEVTPRNRTIVTIGVARGHVVEVTLIEAERIALIEALGGTR